MNILNIPFSSMFYLVFSNVCMLNNFPKCSYFLSVMSVENTYDIPTFLLCFCSISYSNKCGYRSTYDIWFLVHYRRIRKVVLIVAIVS